MAGFSMARSIRVDLGARSVQLRDRGEAMVSSAAAWSWTHLAHPVKSSVLSSDQELVDIARSRAHMGAEDREADVGDRTARGPDFEADHTHRHSGELQASACRTR